MFQELLVLYICFSEQDKAFVQIYIYESQYSHLHLHETHASNNYEYQNTLHIPVDTHLNIYKNNHDTGGKISFPWDFILHRGYRMSPESLIYVT